MKRIECHICENVYELTDEELLIYKIKDRQLPVCPYCYEIITQICNSTSKGKKK